jgi:site-specific DNA-methyltransferase (adenine-specific)
MQDRLIHGDCLAALRQLPNESVDLICTDPPYGDNSGYGRSRRVIAGNEHPLVGLMALAEAYRILRKDCCCFCFLEAKHLALIDFFIRRYTSYCIKEYVVWDKKHIGMGRGFRKRHEMILVLEKGQATFNSAAVPNVLACVRVPTIHHPHTKPVALLETLIGRTTKPGDVVLDPFLGSGTTAVAAKKLGRIFIGIECDERYISVARQRLNTEV